ncbi:chromosome segregation protein SMC [Kaistia dalseonensis]|uniref:Chromosome partition protein Smc n=1 Tax=Kaistia dalseonensis TaxID=410840 RepID=A0ABU0HCS5_9HYPH|nr:chromosome segregation protein SMC [Kaistia dalseonensis]MCX5497479.1 chromosome segregation protein SMC [Kaistia dalseonensis]MDQ0440118.1 chromosome segregation protein [Kaistia dalseonensis]
MKFTRLRVHGFKSFVEGTDFLIEPGLTGVVGPNGCGKSNLVEALRWVMGESSYKNMRASGMDDVIFSGSGNRPARNTAEVTLVVDNAERKAPAAFNDADILEVTRRIEREAGSVYKINGKDVRARDVQLLFADASTGARSPAMVGQGRIGELIAAKPQARRAVLEEAAGISGLYSRRNEAEMRLKAAETNLERLEDVLTEIESQLEALRRQARQANRYRNLSGDIRKAEATVFYLRLLAAGAQVLDSQKALEAAGQAVVARSDAQSGAARDQAVAASGLPALREAEAAAAAALQRITLARDALDADERRMKERIADLDRRLAQLVLDIEREQHMVRENAEILGRLDAEEASLRDEEAKAGALQETANEKRARAEAKLAESEKSLAEATAAHAAIAARRTELERANREAVDRLNRARNQLADVDRELTALLRQIAELPGVAPAQEAVSAGEASVQAADARAIAAERASTEAREAEAAARAPLAEAERTLSGIETEARTLAKILGSGAPAGKRPPLLDALSVAKGFEAALAAAFGDDLDASDDSAAAAHWRAVAALGDDPALPEGAEPLAAKVTAPDVLARALAQTGIVGRADGPRLQPRLKTGQRLVSRQGDLWRWDGYVATADAPTAAALRLANRNRLAELQDEMTGARARVSDCRAALETAATRTRAAQEQERAARDAARAAQRGLDEARARLASAEREAGRLTARRGAVEEQRGRVVLSVDEAEAQRGAAESALAGAADPLAAQQQVMLLRATVAEERGALSEARASADALTRETELRRRRLAAIGEERKNWQSRAANADSQIATLSSRKAEIDAERAALSDAPAEIEAKRRALVAEIGKAEAGRREAAERLATAERALAAADKAAQDALGALSEAREQRGRAEERLNAAQERKREIEARIIELLDCAPHEVVKLAELDPAAPLPDLGQLETRLERLRQEREKLGGVNLRAEDEAVEITTRRDALIKDRDDLIEAIRRLRQGIASLNREGRERLLAAFDVVNAHFQRLFTHLFGGGTAELQLTESDDPLEAGLEILARPPGKKPQTMTLLSGGEQALTAMALIFAVFLTNPAPICVLDEVDAPLDDHNVERFCNLLDEMARATDTRFVTITHNPITMARMNRLFGVTMAERGVSQLVSVDLETAERFLEAV